MYTKIVRDGTPGETSPSVAGLRRDAEGFIRLNALRMRVAAASTAAREPGAS